MMAAESKDDTSFFEGILNKRGRINSSWKQRWFVMREDEQSIEYYKSKENAYAHKKICGTIDLSLVRSIEINCSVDAMLEEKLTRKEYIKRNKNIKSSKPYSFQLVLSKRTYILAADNEQAYISWITELCRVVYDDLLYEQYLLRRENAKTNQWKSRYFTLNKYKQLKCYADESRREFLSCIDLNECKICDEVPKGSHLQYTLEIRAKKESLFIAFPSIEEMVFYFHSWSVLFFPSQWTILLQLAFCVYIVSWTEGFEYCCICVE